MKLVIQRVKEAKVTVSGEVLGQIGQGLLVFLGVAKADTIGDADYLVKKLINLRVFDGSIANLSRPDHRGGREDDQGKMNLSALEVKASFLVVSQFTIMGNCDKGRRPSFDDAADPVKGEELYNYFVNQLKKHNVPVQTGRFRAMMDVYLVNDGPVTFILES